jgi:hypothetical protein
MEYSLQDELSQDRFDNIIREYDRSKLDYNISDPLEGSISLSIFTKDGRKVNSLTFTEGGITDIVNVPEGLKSLSIDGNKLSYLPTNEMRGIVKMSCNRNEIDRVDGMNKLLNLFELYLNDNRVSDLGVLPQNLEQLEVNNNPNIKKICLKSAPNCKSLSCINNPRLYAIYNAPLQNEYFKLYKDDKTQLLLDGDAIYGGSKNDDDIEETKSHTDSEILYPILNESIERYYELKSRSEKDRQKQIRHIITMEASAQKKKKLVRRIVAKCVNCKKDGGTKFWTEDGHLRAICGNKISPCRLDIDIFKGKGISSFEYMYNLLNEEVEADKLEINQLKMNTIFNYMEEKDTAHKFKNVLKDYKETEFIMNGYLENEKNRFINPNIQNVVFKKEHAIQLSLKDTRDLLAEYKNTGDRRILQQIVKKYRDEIAPDLKVIRELKYPVMEMAKQEDGNYLFQLPYNLTALYHYPDTLDKPRVIKFSK